MKKSQSWKWIFQISIFTGVIAWAGIHNGYAAIVQGDAPVSEAAPALPEPDNSSTKSSQAEDPNDSMAPAGPSAGSATIGKTPSADDSNETAQGDSSGAVLPPGLSTLPVEQRIARLEQLTANLTHMNMPQQLTDLQQQVAQLRGQFQVLQHDMETLKNQQRSFYQDLDNRLKQVRSTPISAPNNQLGLPNKVLPLNKASPAGTDSAQLQDSSAYQVAFNFLMNKDYDKAAVAFQNYLRNFPKGQYVGGAHYWLGEVYLAQKDYPRGESEFKIVVSQYPTSDKVPDAKLKIATIHVTQGKIKEAKQEFLEIKKLYPKTTAAQLATIQLQQLRAGH